MKWFKINEVYVQQDVRYSDPHCILHWRIRIQRWDSPSSTISVFTFRRVFPLKKFSLRLTEQSFSSLYWPVLLFFYALFAQWSINQRVKKFTHFQALKVAFYDPNTLFLRISHIHLWNSFLLFYLPFQNMTLFTQ